MKWHCWSVLWCSYLSVLFLTFCYNSMPMMSNWKTEQYIEVIVNCPEVSISSHLPPSCATWKGLRIHSKNFTLALERPKTQRWNTAKKIPKCYFTKNKVTLFRSILKSTVLLSSMNGNKALINQIIYQDISWRERSSREIYGLNSKLAFCSIYSSKWP